MKYLSAPLSPQAWGELHTLLGHRKTTLSPKLEDTATNKHWDITTPPRIGGLGGYE